MKAHKVERCLWNVLVVCILLCLTVAAHAHAQSIGDDTIAYVQQLPVSRFAPKLTGQSFVEWLKKVIAPGVKIEWEINDCGEGTGTSTDSGRDMPACVGARAARSAGYTVMINIVIGTAKKGVMGRPSIYSIFVERRGKMIPVRRLGDLVGILNTD